MEMMAFQVTRRCNQVCKHCCKGKMQKIDMTKEIIDRLFYNDKYYEDVRLDKNVVSSSKKSN
ncbi:MAG: hypothetical protein K2H31_00200, partial [Lachnospiraceae bacterium]|nr:hypothetical protein [Lachnospiraceae bacterium]